MPQSLVKNYIHIIFSTKYRNDFIDENIYGKLSIEEAIKQNKNHFNMYTICYRTEILRKNNIKLLEKCFYTDTQYAMYPIPYINSIYIFHKLELYEVRNILSY